jgi:hypothetical protein
VTPTDRFLGFGSRLAAFTDSFARFPRGHDQHTLRPAKQQAGRKVRQPSKRVWPVSAADRCRRPI